MEKGAPVQIFHVEIVDLNNLCCFLFLQMDEHVLSAQRGQHNMDPYPIYTIIDKKIKQEQRQLQGEVSLLVCVHVCV